MKKINIFYNVALPCLMENMTESKSGGHHTECRQCNNAATLWRPNDASVITMTITLNITMLLILVNCVNVNLLRQYSTSRYKFIVSKSNYNNPLYEKTYFSERQGIKFSMNEGVRKALKNLFEFLTTRWLLVKINTLHVINSIQDFHPLCHIVIY